MVYLVLTMVNTAAETFSVDSRVRIISGPNQGELATVTRINQPEPAFGTGDYGVNLRVDGEPWERTYYGANLQLA